jgi:hypothetical protein
MKGYLSRTSGVGFSQFALAFAAIARQRQPPNSEGACQEQENKKIDAQATLEPRRLTSAGDVTITNIKPSEENENETRTHRILPQMPPRSFLLRMEGNVQRLLLPLSVSLRRFLPFREDFVEYVRLHILHHKKNSTLA